MTYEHDKCTGEVGIISDGYALCTLSGDEGEYIAVDESDDRITVVAIPLLTCNRLETSKPATASAAKTKTNQLPQPGCFYYEISGPKKPCSLYKLPIKGYYLLNLELPN